MQQTRCVHAPSSSTAAVCDCYAKWKLLSQNGVDTTALLANGINHPSREMAWMFAYSLLETMMR